MPVRDLRSLSVWLKIALVCISLGVLLFVLGFATETWIESGDYYAWYARGLWKFKACRGSSCSSAKYLSSTLPDYHKATQAMECIGLIGLLLAFLILLLYVFVDQCRRREAMYFTLFCIFGAVVCMVIGFIVFATNYNGDIGWSMGVAMAGCVCTFVAGVMCLLQIMGR